MEHKPNDRVAVGMTDIPAAVRSTLEAYFDQRQPEVEEIGAPVAQAVAHLREFVLDGGKRIRPTYAWAGYSGSLATMPGGGEDPEAVLRAISSLELIQACALIHDDIIDASDTRRARPTVHRAVEASHRDLGLRGNSATYGRNTAILIGDLALLWAEDMWRYSGVSLTALERAAEPWRGMRTEVIGGQILDIVLEASGRESAEMAERVSRYKTAAYTVERPLHLGAALAGASADTIAAFRGYGRDVGIAFQLRDDILGVFGDETVTGKPAGDDLRDGKRTVLLARALSSLDASSPRDAERLRRGVGRVTDPRDVAELAELVESSGAVSDVEKRIQQLLESGIAHLEGTDISPDTANVLRDLAVRATERRA